MYCVSGSLAQSDGSHSLNEFAIEHGFLIMDCNLAMDLGIYIKSIYVLMRVRSIHVISLNTHECKSKHVYRLIHLIKSLSELCIDVCSSLSLSITINFDALCARCCVIFGSTQHICYRLHNTVHYLQLVSHPICVYVSQESLFYYFLFAPLAAALATAMAATAKITQIGNYCSRIFGIENVFSR